MAADLTYLLFFALAVASRTCSELMNAGARRPEGRGARCGRVQMEAEASRVRLERTTCDLEDRCSVQLSYRDVRGSVGRLRIAERRLRIEATIRGGARRAGALWLSCRPRRARRWRRGCHRLC